MPNVSVGLPQIAWHDGDVQVNQRGFARASKQRSPVLISGRYSYKR
jgi:hypothetical protein